MLQWKLTPFTQGSPGTRWWAPRRRKRQNTKEEAPRRSDGALWRLENQTLNWLSTMWRIVYYVRSLCDLNIVKWRSSIWFWKKNSQISLHKKTSPWFLSCAGTMSKPRSLSDSGLSGLRHRWILVIVPSSPTVVSTLPPNSLHRSFPILPSLKTPDFHEGKIDLTT